MSSNFSVFLAFLSQTSKNQYKIPYKQVSYSIISFSLCKMRYIIFHNSISTILFSEKGWRICTFSINLCIRMHTKQIIGTQSLKCDSDMIWLEDIIEI